MKKGLLALLFACSAPQPRVVSYYPHMPVETQRQVAESALRELLPQACNRYEFESPEKIQCHQSLRMYRDRMPTDTTIITHSDLSCSQVEGIMAVASFPPFYHVVLRGDCNPENRMSGPIIGDQRNAGKCRDSIRWDVAGKYPALARDFYEALYAYCTSYGYQLQLYGSPEMLFGERRY